MLMEILIESFLMEVADSNRLEIQLQFRILGSKKIRSLMVIEDLYMIQIQE